MEPACDTSAWRTDPDGEALAPVSPRIVDVLTKPVPPADLYEQHRDYFIPPEKIIEREEGVKWVLSDVGSSPRLYPGGLNAQPGIAIEDASLWEKAKAGSPSNRRSGRRPPEWELRHRRDDMY